MAKSVKRICPACGVKKTFRIDQKTCGCKNTVNEQSEREIYLRKQVDNLGSQLEKFKEFHGYNKELNDQIIDVVQAFDPLPPVPYTNGKAAESEMAAVLKLSDWHIGQVTDKKATEGFGEFNWALAQERMQYITKKFIGWVEVNRRSFKIPKLYVFSEGDMVSGDIHQELLVTNEFPAPVQAVKAGGLLAQTIATLSPHFSEVHVIEGNIDNHSRLTKKLQFAQGAENSWQYVVHAVANAYIEKHKNVNIVEMPGISHLVDVQGIKFLTMHGHQIKAWMGIPYYGIERHRGKEASKRIQVMLEQQRAVSEQLKKFQKDVGFDYISQGHWHVPGWVSGNILINGCLPGTSEYDHASGRYARPAQVSFLVHPKHGVFNFVPWGVKQ